MALLLALLLMLGGTLILASAVNNQTISEYIQGLKAA